jgi:hypothetical protein
LPATSLTDVREFQAGIMETDVDSGLAKTTIPTLMVRGWP